MSGKKTNPYRTTGKPDKLNEPVSSPTAPARKHMSRRSLAAQPGAIAVVGGTQLATDEMEFGTEDDLPTNVSRCLMQQRDPEANVEYHPPPPAPPTPPQPDARQSSVTAVLVHPDEEERKIEKRLEEERKDIPLDEPAQEAPWWKRRSTILTICVILLIVVIVSVAVTTTNKNKSGANVPTLSPTSSPAPTALAIISLVLQLDEKPWETGWMLECDGATLQSAPPGTYALIIGRPHFRVDYQAVVTVGADCQLTILDTGGDGLDPGFYAIYNGIDVGNPNNLITGGTVTGPESIISFSPGSTAPPSPTAAPTTGNGTTTALCTVCPDGTPVPFEDAPAQGWGSLTCKELDFLAAVTSNTAVCHNMQDQAAFGCGCRNFCTTMCPDRISDIDPANTNNTVFVRSNDQVTCGDLQAEIENASSNSQDQCLSANVLGEDVCGCPTTGPFCRICEGGGNNTSTNPSEEALQTEIVPGVTCLDITGFAYTLKRDDPRTGYFQLCPAYLSIGAYCGCGTPQDGLPFCRLCGGPQDLLPEPARMVNSTLLGYQTTCYHIEFLSNIADNTTTQGCDVYREDAAETCCSA